MATRRELPTGAAGQRREELSRAEICWLTGDYLSDPTPLEKFFLWSLDHGHVSMQKGRQITATELLDRYGHLVTAPRRRALRDRLESVKQAEAERQQKSSAGDR
jgi:hypothetical protein